MNDETHSLLPPRPHHHFQPHTGDSLIALGHLQVVEVDSALHVGMEGEEATQEVILKQVELRIFSQLSQGPQQEDQGADHPALGSHGCEVEVPEVALPPWRAGNLTPGDLCRHLHMGPVTVQGAGKHLGQVERFEGSEGRGGGWNEDDPS